MRGSQGGTRLEIQENQSIRLFGTFLYVCLCELLIEVFHHREDSLRRIALLTAGIALTVAFEGLGHV